LQELEQEHNLFSSIVDDIIESVSRMGDMLGIEGEIGMV
jgi:hypothetical protein